MHVANQASKDVTHIRLPNKFANGKCSREGHVLYLLLLGVLELRCRIGTPLCDPSTGSRCLNPALSDETEGRDGFPCQSNNKSIHSECRKYRETCFTIVKYVSNLLYHKAFLQVFATLF